MQKQEVQAKIYALLKELVENTSRKTVLTQAAIEVLGSDAPLEDKLKCVKEMYQVVIDAGMAYALTIWTDTAIEMMEPLYDVDEIEY